MHVNQVKQIVSILQQAGETNKETQSCLLGYVVGLEAPVGLDMGNANDQVEWNSFFNDIPGEINEHYLLNLTLAQDVANLTLLYRQACVNSDAKLSDYANKFINLTGKPFGMLTEQGVVAQIRQVLSSVVEPRRAQMEERRTGMEAFNDLFDNTMSALPPGENYKIYNSFAQAVSQESWDDLKFKTDKGDQISLPEGILKFKEWIENEIHTKKFNISEAVETLRFNPALESGSIKSIIGSSYKGIDCRYLIPIFRYRMTHTTSNAYATYVYHVYYMGVMVVDPNSSKYGKVGFFPIGKDASDFNQMRLHDAWKFFKWFQPDFKYNPEELSSQFETVIDKLKRAFSTMSDKIKGLFK